MHLRMKFTALKKNSTHSKQVRGAWTIKVDFYLFLFGVLALFVLSGKSILESNNANAAKTKIKLLYSTVHLFFMIFLTRFQARHLSEKPLRCKVLAKSEYTNAFLQSWKVFPDVEVTCEYAATWAGHVPMMSMETSKLFQRCVDWLSAAATIFFERMERCMQIHGRNLNEKILWKIIVFNSVFSTF